MKLSHNTVTMINAYYYSNFNKVVYDVLGKKSNRKLHARVLRMLESDLKEEGLTQQEIDTLMSKVAGLGIRKAVELFDGLVDNDRLAWWRLF